ncbi:metallophosphoesterase [Luteimonas gilva]|uniref:Metallophosphoesterase n=1 Tax=Luteimonas gilva TaxID=2572684 RepID=A0A4U5JMF0_9GAMM|nr:metallophosphoesterase [Luteimonas gilva]TKR30832.1 metallophosphoesterase [Luteimonas gilva]
MKWWTRTQGRRRALQWTVRGSALLILAGLLWGFVWEPGRLVERDYAIALPHWPVQCDGLRLDVVSDTHTGSPHNGVDNLDRIVQRLTASDSQAVLMAGDYVILRVFMGTYVPAEKFASHLRPLTARKPVYAVLGNHDWWKDGAKVRRALESAGVIVLENQAAEIRLSGCTFWIAGLGDFWEGHPNIGATFAAVDDAAPVVALTHNPDLFPRIPARAALTVAGHTHGGQVRLPFIGTPVVPARQRYVSGTIVENGKTLFVSPGIGTSILPVRFGVPPEISRLTLRSARADDSQP